jgi:outer membrane protein TolC
MRPPDSFTRPPAVARVLASVACLVACVVTLAAPSPAAAKAYRLPELLEMARTNNPGLAAGAQATHKIEAQLTEANRSWWPSGELLSLLAPVPDIHCQVPDGSGLDAQKYCMSTDVYELKLKLSGIFTRTELRLVQPVFTFGKISAARDAARSGVEASRSQQRGAAAEVALNVRRAYYGIKFARGVLETFDEGMGFLDDAQKHIEEALEKGTGDVTQTDKLRMRTVRADIDARRLETEKLGAEAKAGLRALMGDRAPADLDIDDDELVAIEIVDHPLAYYQDQARANRPEVKALENLVASKRSLARMKRNEQFPDLVLIGTMTYALAPNIDNPQNAFVNDPFNTFGFGLAAALRMPLDIGVRNARASQAAADASETELRREEALAGINFEVARAFGQLDEAKKRHTAVRSGERAAKSWINAVSANFAAGLAETKDFQDALVAFFGFRVRVLQAAFDLNIAAATLARTTGIEVGTPPPPEPDDEDAGGQAETTSPAKDETKPAPAAKKPAR